MAELEKQLQALRLEKEKLEEVEAERERGTAKGRTFEEAVADAVDADRARPGRRRGGGRRHQGGHRQGRRRGGRDRRLQRARRAGGSYRGEGQPAVRPEGARASWTRRMAERSADFAVLVVPTEDEVPAKMQPLREYNGDKLVVALDPEARLARARARLPARARPRADEALGRRRHRRRRGARRRGARARRARPRSARSSSSSPARRRASTRRTSGSRHGGARPRAARRRSTRSCGRRTRRAAPPDDQLEL